MRRVHTTSVSPPKKPNNVGLAADAARNADPGYAWAPDTHVPFFFHERSIFNSCCSNVISCVFFLCGGVCSCGRDFGGCNCGGCDCGGLGECGGGGGGGGGGCDGDSCSGGMVVVVVAVAVVVAVGACLLTFIYIYIYSSRRHAYAESTSTGLKNAVTDADYRGRMVARCQHSMTQHSMPPQQQPGYQHPGAGQQPPHGQMTQQMQWVEPDVPHVEQQPASASQSPPHTPVH